MNTERRPLVVANWKMNGSNVANSEWINRFASRRYPCDVAVCAPFVYLSRLIEAFRGTAIQVGAQHVSDHGPGAFTGEIAAEMLRDIGVGWVIVGHSERRAMFGDTDERVAAATAKALETGLKPIVCIGESLAERDSGQTISVVLRQMDAVIARCGVAVLDSGAWAYEPVWAIGTGRTASPAQAQQVHAELRKRLADANPAAALRARVLYGGSVKPSNAAELFAQPDIDGGLIGGASLVADDFAAICAAAQ